MSKNSLSCSVRHVAAVKSGLGGSTEKVPESVVKSLQGVVQSQAHGGSNSARLRNTGRLHGAQTSLCQHRLSRGLKHATQCTGQVKANVATPDDSDGSWEPDAHPVCPCKDRAILLPIPAF